MSKDSIIFKQQYAEQYACGVYITFIYQLKTTFNLSVAAQYKDPSNNNIIHLNKQLEQQIANLNCGLTYIPLDLHTVKLFIFVNGQFANIKDLTSQIGYKIFLTNKMTTKNTFMMTDNLIYQSLTKCKCVTQSVLVSEIYIMIHNVDIEIATATTFNIITTKLGIPTIFLIICIDLFLLYEYLVKLGTIKKKHLMIDIMSLWQSYKHQELFEIWQIHGQDNPTNVITKSDANHALQIFIGKNYIILHIERYIKKDN